MEEYYECPVCGGELTVLGVLGRRVHCRCRNCGIDSSFEIPEKTDLEFELDEAAIDAGGFDIQSA